MITPESPAKAVIICNDNGPYLVKNVDQYSGTNGEALTAKSTMALCRCGQSSNKPFCDGTHAKVGFSSDIDYENRTKDRKDTYVSEKITIHDNRGLCAHTAVCTNSLASVFRMKQRPWIDPDQASVEKIKAVIDQCPSGALTYSIQGQDEAGQAGEVTVNVIPNGPYKISGAIEIEGIKNLEGASNKTRTFCRCGHSKNKPFCDGSHWDAGFKDG